jgi:hypothetical protein
VDVARTSERERERERDKTGLGKHVMSNSVLSSKIQKITTSGHLDHQHQVDCYSRSCMGCEGGREEFSDNQQVP